MLTLSEVASWDGWKILLAQLGLNFDLPKPRTDDPNYVPTAPTVSVSEITVDGKVTINFSEPVFRLEDMTTSTMGLRRSLAKPFLDITIEPGENSDPDYLGMTSTETWKDDQTIELVLKFEKPPAISASDPEDILILGFYGPFFDQEDGLPIESDSVLLTKELPPQVIPGALTDALSAAGESLQASTTSFLAGNAAMNIVMQGSLN